MLTCVRGRIGRPPYSGPEDVWWTVAPRSAAGIRLRLLRLSTAAGADFLRVYGCADASCLNSWELGAFSGSQTPPTVAYDAAVLRLHWLAAGGNGSFGGWSAEWTSLDGGRPHGSPVTLARFRARARGHTFSRARADYRDAPANRGCACSHPHWHIRPMRKAKAWLGTCVTLNGSIEPPVCVDGHP
jgi:hypothetical protein